MKIRTIFFIFSLAFLAVILAIGKLYLLPIYNQNIAQQQKAALPSPTVVPSNELSVEDELNTLSPKEKVSQLISAPLSLSSVRTVAASPSAAPLTNQNTLEKSMRWIQKNKPGFVTLFGQKISSSSAQAIIEEIQQTDSVSTISAVPILIAVDHEGGTVQRLNGVGFTQLPSWSDVCQKTAEEQSALLTTSAKELSVVGVSVVFGPVIDVGKNPAMGKRICSSQGEEVQKMAEKWIQVFDQYGIASVIKHYPGIGGGKKDLHAAYEEVPFNSSDILLFTDLLSLYPNIGVMTAHVGIQDSEVEGPCSLSEKCLAVLKPTETQLLFTDALEMESALVDLEDPQSTKKLLEVSEQAIEAGNNVLVFGNKVSPEELDKIIVGLADQYQDSNKLKSKVDANLKKIWQFKKAINFKKAE
jgi:beta-N-acetylhexosaminidase